MITREWLCGLPKAELHVHLEGTVTPELFGRIAARNGYAVPNDVNALFRCDDFNSFLNAFLKVIQALRRPQDFADIAAAYLKKSAEQGVRHVELMFSPATIRYFHADAEPEPMVGAICEQLEQAKRAHGVSSLLIFDMVRNLGEEAAMADIDLALACRDIGVIGIGLGGDERRFPARGFQRVFDRARRLGLRRTVHAGEADGSASIADAVRLLNAERIGHGVAAKGQSEVQTLLRERHVAIDACPTSNAVTGAWDRTSAHPIGEFMSAGIAVTLSSDDPAFFHSSLLDEYEALAQSGFTQAQLMRIARTSLEASFAEEKEKRTLLDELDAYGEASGVRQG